jgi:precorrin-8X/cobalt-precorrin-8 methylmutase
MDAEMVRMGIVRTLMSPKVPLFCTTHDPRAAPMANDIGNTSSAAGVALWEADIEGGLAVFGNAPTALFYCLEQIAAGTLPKPAAIVGLPVGFVGAAESKEALIEHAADLGLPFITLRGRMGGSAMASAVLNALAKILADEGSA